MFASKDLFLTRPSGYQISRSVRLRSSASAYFNRTPAGAGSQTTWTWSGWVKRGALGSNQTIISADRSASAEGSGNYFTSSDTLQVYAWNGSAFIYNYITTQVFRDPSAWYHIVITLDTTNATSTDRVRIYVNGSRITAFGTSTAPSQNATGYINTTQAHAIGRSNYNTSLYFDGYLTEINFIDGQALTPSSFGETNSVTGVWQPKRYAGTYGTNGFYLNFSDNSGVTATTIGKDYSGNGNNWTPNNISVTAGATYDSMLDSPTPYADGGNGRGNYCVMNPLTPNRCTLVDGNLRTTGGDKYGIATVGMLSGKWYAEMTVNAVGGESSCGVANGNPGSNTYVGQNDGVSWGYYIDGKKYFNGSGSVYGATFTTGDVIGIAFDADNGTLTFYKNNTSQGTAFTGLTSGPYYFAMSGRTSTSANDCSINFGQRPFTYTPPSGYSALNTQNLPTPTISNGANYMAASLFTGTSGNVTVSNAVNGISFQPDFLWFKARSNAQGHSNVDSVRGASKLLQTNLTNAESTLTNPPTFNADGFTSTTDIHTNGYTYVAWQWNAGGSTVTNTNGSISAQVRANATAGFSVVTYTGTGANATVGHGLNVAPKMVIVKRRNAISDWCVYVQAIGAGNRLLLSQTNASAADATMWNSTAPTSSVFSIGTNVGVNSANTFVAYCFATVAGYSAFGSYTGNGSADGPFVYCGFRPRYLLIKRTDAAASWYVYDTSRATYNTTNAWLQPDTAAAENSATTWEFDLLSNGFKVRNSGAFSNASGGTYIYVAFAENPFKNSLAR